jgi:hypothetical protein
MNNISELQCTECPAMFTPKSRRQKCCSQHCKEHRIRRRALFQQKEMRDAVAVVRAAHKKAEDVAGKMAWAGTVEELEAAYEASLSAITKSLQNLKAAKHAAILRHNYEIAWDGLELALGDLVESILRTGPDSAGETLNIVQAW